MINIVAHRNSAFALLQSLLHSDIGSRGHSAGATF
jgi:hypothetical protein